ncbi:hypothetical protein MNBD_GAMMA07-2696 [hydrothermal vent metagenome]|uniref:HTH tetR-type domain-containing protein n=1 Tax=hydrothermal vent metagenome TaxID=652676 RepID=A0A3B0X1I7_9ZZZZ
MGTKGSANRQRIIVAADHLFYSHGYNQTSFSDISDETGIPRGNFYYYFKTKEDILGAVVDARVSDFKEILQQCEKDTLDPLERLQLLAQFPLKHESDVLKYGCPIGSLSLELMKEQASDISQMPLTAVFDLLKEWVEVQLSALGQTSNADEIAKDLLAKLQGVTLIASVYNDVAYLHRGINDVKDWLNQILSH